MASIVEILFGLFLVIFSVTGLASTQIPDHLLYQGNTLNLIEEPLQSYFDKHSYPKAILVPQCWTFEIARNYIATWKIENYQLFLVEIDNSCFGEHSGKIPISAIFPGRTPPVHANWFTGKLHAYPKDKVCYTYDQCIQDVSKVFKFRKGKLLR